MSRESTREALSDAPAIQVARSEPQSPLEIDLAPAATLDAHVGRELGHQFERQSEPEPDFEPERYELAEAAPYRFDLERRDFFRVVGGGLLVAATLATGAAARAQESGSAGRGRAAGGREARELAAWLHIDEQGKVTAYTGKVEIGQNIRTSLAQAVADELRLPLAAVTMVMADTDLVPYDAGTFGSQSTPRMARQLARAAVTAREMLMDVAATRWQAQAQRASLTVKDGRIVHPDSRTLSYGELTQGQKLSGVVADDAAVATPDKWTLRGTEAKKVNGREIVTGGHQFTPDVVRPNMVYGRIVRPDRIGGTLVSADDSAARAMTGVTVVRDGEFIGVVAPSERVAVRAAAAVKAEWRALANQPSSETIYQHLKATGATTQAPPAGGGAPAAGQSAAPSAASAASTASTASTGSTASTPSTPPSGAASGQASATATPQGAGGAANRGAAGAPSPVARVMPAPFVVGDVVQATGSGGHILSASYFIPYIAHVPMEPRCAVAEWTDGKLTVWTGTQRPFGVRGDLAQAFRVSEEQVRVIVPDTGSAYGGKHTGEYAIEAARLAKAANRPVKLVWTRAEEFTWGYFRPAGVIDVKSVTDGTGRLVGWEFDNWNSGASSIRTPYDVPHQRIQFHPADSPLRQGSYRGLAATANHYAREMHMDAIARALKLDPVEFRLKNLKDERMRAVLTAAAQRIGWPGTRTNSSAGASGGGRGNGSRSGNGSGGGPSNGRGNAAAGNAEGDRNAANRAFGIACGTEKGSFVGTAVELSRTTDAGAGSGSSAGADARAGAGAGASGSGDSGPGFRIERIVVSFECGAIVNPDGLRNQVEGSIVQGLGGALFEAISFADGRILNGTLAKYRVPRFTDIPPIEIVLLNRPDLPSAGAGETPIVAVAPAIGSAARAFGTVVTALPIRLDTDNGSAGSRPA